MHKPLNVEAYIKLPFISKVDNRKFGIYSDRMKPENIFNLTALSKYPYKTVVSAKIFAETM